MKSVQTRARVEYLDNFRSVIVLAVVAFHAAVAYKVRAVSWWYVGSADTNSVFDLFISVADTFLMPALFFAAGFFALPSLVKKGCFAFVKDKFIRLQLPALLGAFVMVPILLYTRATSLDVQGQSLFEFWTSYAATCFDWSSLLYKFDDHFNYSYLWFLTVLFSFFLVLGVVGRFFDFDKYLQSHSAEDASSPWIGILSFGVVVSLSFFLVHLFFKETVWINLGNLLMFQVTRLPIYIGFFILGIVSNAKGWTSPERFLRAGLLWVPVALLLTLVFVNMFLSFYVNPTVLIKLLHGFIRVFLGLAFVMTALIIILYLTRMWKPKLDVLVSNSYGIYLFHMAILIPLQYWLNQMNISIFAKFGIAFIVASTCSLILVHMLRRFALVRAVI